MAPPSKKPTRGESTVQNGRSAPPSTGHSTPTLGSKDLDPPHQQHGPHAKPDKAAYDLEQEQLKKEIDALQSQLSALKDKISSITKFGPGHEKRIALRAELDSLREQQSNNKLTRGKILDQLKALQEGIQKKVKDLQLIQSKTPYKTVEEIDARIKQLDKQVESGNLKLGDEKRALQEIGVAKRQRRVVEGYQANQESIEADRRTADDLRAQLDNPETKAAMERFDALRAELDVLKREEDEVYAGRTKLYEERDALQTQLSAVYDRKRDSAQRFRLANEQHRNKINEERARRAERARAQRAAEEAQKKLEITQRMREEATALAFQSEILDCQNLIDFFANKASGSATPLLTTTNTIGGSSAVERVEIAGVPKLELRQVDAALQDGLVVRKKKGEDQESYFVVKGKKGKKGSGSGVKQDGTPDFTSHTPSSAQLNVPLTILSALLPFSIPPPTSSADVARVVEDLRTKKAWFEANQATATAEKVAKAEADIARMVGDVKLEAKSDINPEPLVEEHAPSTQADETVVVAPVAVESEA